MKKESTASTIPDSILSAAVGLLRPYAPNLTASALMDAITREDPPRIEKPFTRRQAAELLGVSLQTLARWQREGRVRTIHATPRIVYIAPDSVRALIGA